MMSFQGGTAVKLYPIKRLKICLANFQLLLNAPKCTTKQKRNNSGMHGIMRMKVDYNYYTVL